MEVTPQHLADFLSQAVFSYHIHKAELEYVDGQEGQDVVIDLQAECATGIHEMEILARVFKSTDMQIPVWEDVSAGCDTCGHGSLSKLDGLTIRNVCSFQESVYEASLIRWEQELDRQELNRKQQAAQEQARREREQRRKQNLAEQKRLLKLKEQQNLLFEHGLSDVFDQLWAIYDPLRAIPLRDRAFHEKVQSLPQNIRTLLYIFRKIKPDHQNYGGIKQCFMEKCEKSPKKMKKVLFPDGKRIKLNYRAVRSQSDQKMRKKKRELELEGFIAF